MMLSCLQPFFLAERTSRLCWRVERGRQDGQGLVREKTRQSLPHGDRRGFSAQADMTRSLRAEMMGGARFADDARPVYGELIEQNPLSLDWTSECE